MSNLHDFFREGSTWLEAGHISEEGNSIEDKIIKGETT
jgi:hypothetical protein